MVVGRVSSRFVGLFLGGLGSAGIGSGRQSGCARGCCSGCEDESIVSNGMDKSFRLSTSFEARGWQGNEQLRP